MYMHVCVYTVTYCYFLLGVHSYGEARSQTTIRPVFKTHIATTNGTKRFSEFSIITFHPIIMTYIGPTPFGSIWTVLHKPQKSWPTKPTGLGVEVGQLVGQGLRQDLLPIIALSSRHKKKKRPKHRDVGASFMGDVHGCTLSKIWVNGVLYI